MASCKNQKKSCVFVGNIAYHAGEAEVKEVCEEIGPIVSFKLMTDKNGKRKGFGFCEYLDEETALTALRNLNGVEVRGRTLKVSFADEGKNNGKQQGSNLGTSQDDDPLTLFLGKYTSDQLIEIVSEMNELIANNVQEAQRLLELCPGLPKAIVQAQLKLGIVPPHAIHVAKILSGSDNSVPQSSTQFQILDHGQFPVTFKKELGTGPGSGSGSAYRPQVFSQIQKTHNHREFSATVNQDRCKRVFDSGLCNSSESISHPSKRLRVKEGKIELGGGSDSISHPPTLLKVKEEEEEERFKPAEQAPHQVGQVQLSAELLKVLLEKQMLLRQPPAEMTKALSTPFDQQQQQWRNTYPRPAIPFPS